MFGSPVGGQILGESRSLGSDAGGVLDSYQKLVWYDGALLLGSALCVMGVRGFDAIEKGKWRWRA